MIKLGPALAISTKLLSHPLVSAVATAAVGASLKQVMPLEDAQLPTLILTLTLTLT